MPGVLDAAEPRVADALCVLLKHLIPFWGGLITGDKSGFVYLAQSIRAFPDQRGLAALMEDAGFTEVTWKNYTGGIAAVHVAHKRGVNGVGYEGVSQLAR